MKFQDFTHLYPLSKTLRFELKPIGKTLDHIESKNFLHQDKQRAEDYKKVKKIIDKYHKAYIEKCLADFDLRYDNFGKRDSLSEYYECIKNAQSSNGAILEKIQANLRKQISKHLQKSDEFKRIDKKELFTEDLPNFVAPEDQKLISEFKNFTTYFSGFHQNRQNMYSEEAKSTAIAYRLINENLPKFIDNINIFDKIKQISELADCLEDLRADFNISAISDMFDLSYFNFVLTQKQIELYNAIIGGRSEGEVKIKGLNEYINLYNQSHKDAKLPKFKVLYKQILSDREQLSWLPEKFESDDELLRAVKEYYETVEDPIENLKVLLESIGTYDLDGIFLRNDLQLTHISKRLFGDWSKIQAAIIEDLKQVRKQKKSEDGEKYEEELKKLYKKQGSFSIGYVNKVAELKADSYFSSLDAVNTEEIQQDDIFTRTKKAYADVELLLQNTYPEHKKLMQNKDDVAAIKAFLDALLELLHYVKPLLGTGEEPDKENRFYGDFMQIWDQLNLLTPLYNKVRNYVTRKPYSVEKIKLNFESSQLLGGWDKNKERDCLAVVLRKNGNYYLGIMDKANNKVLDHFPCDGDCYEKMEYKLLPGANKMLPKVFFSKSRIDEFSPSEEVLSIYDTGAFKKGVNFNLQSCHKLIDFYKAAIAKHEDWNKFEFNFSSTESYNDISGFYREVEEQGYKLTFQPISTSYIDSLVDEGKLYLFQIYNKDFSAYSKGTPNMHTLYWRMLFDERNLRDVVYQLNGGAELFYREHSINSQRPTHPANVTIKNKNTQNSKSESCFTYDLIKNRRYTVDKFQFHVPITLNFKGSGGDNINSLVRRYLHSAENPHIIGIDRGERNLLYVVVIDSQGRICKQISLNEICNSHNGNTYKTNYHDLLDKREQERLIERQSWQAIEGIKELKEGYLSQVVHKVAQLMIEYEAIVVLEDLNMGFMQSRQKVEKSVYQDFERMLINKLNYLVDKKADPMVAGGLLNAYQLTSKFDSFKKLGKQSGFLFYVPAWNTSKIDPSTGFVNLINLRYENKDKAKGLFDKFDSIRYNESKDWFEFDLDYANFSNKAADTRTNWTICTYGSRIETFRNSAKNSQWDNREINLTEEFKALFAKHDVDIRGNLKEAIVQQSSASFFEQLMRLLRLTMQMRNSVTGTNIDYIISPVTNSDGSFFDSRNGDPALPQDADANGAYNIARKGLLMIEQLKQSDDPNALRFDLSNNRWLQFAQRDK